MRNGEVVARHGVLHGLPGIRLRAELLSHPKLGASREGFVIERLLQASEVDHAHFLATHQDAEIDLLLMRGARRIGVEIKRSDARALTRPFLRLPLVPRLGLRILRPSAQ